MGVTVSGQAWQAAVSLLVGAGAGILYDLFRVIRRSVRSRLLTAILDGIFWAVCAVALFVLGLAAGHGRQRIFMVTLAFLGAALYFVTASPLILKAGLALAGLLGSALRFLLTPLRLLLGFMKKFLKKSKKFFSLPARWFKIRGKKKQAPVFLGTEEIKYAFQTYRYSYEDHHSGAAGVRRGDAGSGE